jgi:RNA polymerase-binding protein DksA
MVVTHRRNHRRHACCKAKERLTNATQGRQETTVNPATPAARQIETRLRRRYQEIWTDISRELDKHDEQRYQDLVQGAGDAEDDATANLLVDLNLSELDRDVEELRAVQGALARLRRGEYGRCQNCGRAIPRARLEALPHAALCVDCQRRTEQSRVSTPSL